MGEANPGEYRNYVSSCRMLELLGRQREAAAVADAAVQAGVLNDRWQRPSHFLPGLASSAWQDATTWRVTHVLERGHSAVRPELRNPVSLQPSLSCPAEARKPWHYWRAAESQQSPSQTQRVWHKPENGMN